MHGPRKQRVSDGVRGNIFLSLVSIMLVFHDMNTVSLLGGLKRGGSS